jgi:hypothetical protein
MKRMNRNLVVEVGADTRKILLQRKIVRMADLQDRGLLSSGK